MTHKNELVHAGCSKVLAETAGVARGDVCSKDQVSGAFSGETLCWQTLLHAARNIQFRFVMIINYLAFGQGAACTGQDCTSNAAQPASARQCSSPSQTATRTGQGGSSRGGRGGGGGLAGAGWGGGGGRRARMEENCPKSLVKGGQPGRGVRKCTPPAMSVRATTCFSTFEN